MSGSTSPLPAGARTKSDRRGRPFPVFVLLILWASFLGAELSAKTRSEWTGVERIVAIGDLHGDYENFVKILTRLPLPVVDRKLHWNAGSAHLVQMGDVMDRGSDAQKILDLLMKLEKEAETAGGKVHVLLGNHEELNITGLVFRYPEYLTVDQFRSFLPDDYRKKQEESLQKAIMELRRKRENRTTEEEYISEFWDRLKADEKAQNQYLTNFNRRYGAWLLKQNAVIKINDTIFVHGGISEEYSLMGIDKINDRLRLELADYRRAAERGEEAKIQQREILYMEDSPLWYRAFAQTGAEIEIELDRILQNLGASHMVIAHTPTIPTGAELKRFGGKLWIIDTGIASIYMGGWLSALVIQNGEFVIWTERHE